MPTVEHLHVCVQSLLCRNIRWVKFTVGEPSQHLLTGAHTSSVACMPICMYRFCFKCYVGMIQLRCTILWKWNLDWTLTFSLKIVHYLHRTNWFTYNILTNDLPVFLFSKERQSLQILYLSYPDSGLCACKILTRICACWKGTYCIFLVHETHA